MPLKHFARGGGGAAFVGVGDVAVIEEEAELEERRQRDGDG